MTLPNPYTGTIPAAAYGGGWPWGHPALLCLHDVESPLAPGYARSLAEYFSRSKAAGGPGTSAHGIAGPDALIQLVPDWRVSYNCGPNGNPITLALEQTGYARFTRAQWRTVAGRQQASRVAAWFAYMSQKWSIPMKWATDDEIVTAYRTGKRVGWCHHYDISRVIHGTDHWDTGSSYPDDELLAEATSLANPDDREWWEMAIPTEEINRIVAAFRPMIMSTKGDVASLDEHVTAEVEGVGLWILDLLVSGELHPNSRYGRGKFRDNPVLAAVVAALQGHGILQLEDRILALETTVAELLTPTDPPADPPADPPLVP